MKSLINQIVSFSEVKKFNFKYNYTEEIKKISAPFCKLYTIILTITMYKGLLDIIYCVFIAEKYSFFYFKYNIPNIINGWISVFFICFFMEKFYKQNCNSSMLMIALTLLYYIPITTYCGYGGGSSVFFLSALFYWFFLSFLQVVVPVFVYDGYNSFFNISKKATNILMIVASLIIIYVWIKYTHCRILLNFIDVYDVRLEAAEYSIPTVLTYLMQFMNIVIPMLILLGLYRKQYVLLLWLLLLTFLNFSIDGSKSVIFFALILIGGYIFYRQSMIVMIAPFAVIAELISIIESIVGNGYLVSLLFRRQGMVLAQLSEYYYRFFSTEGVVLFRDGFLGKLGFDGLYKQTIGNVVGNNFETQIISCNNGLLADAWANMGVIGIVVMPLVLIICFRFLDFVSYGIDKRLTIGLILYYAVVFANSFCTTVLLSHGYIIMCLMLIFFQNEKRWGSNNECS